MAATVASGMLGVAALVLGMAGCSDGWESEDCDPGDVCGIPATGETTSVPTHAMQGAGEQADVSFRPVLSITDGPSDSDAPAACAPVPTSLPADGPSQAYACADGRVEASYVLGPSSVGGSAIESARAIESVSTGGWEVQPVLRSGAAGIDAFNELAAHCFAADPTCPTGQLAIVVDGVVLSAPTIAVPRFEADAITITGDFTEASATALAERLDPA